jgi:hypothetical protein
MARVTLAANVMARNMETRRREIFMVEDEVVNFSAGVVETGPREPARVVRSLKPVRENPR